MCFWYYVYSVEEFQFGLNGPGLLFELFVGSSTIMSGKYQFIVYVPDLSYGPYMIHVEARMKDEINESPVEEWYKKKSELSMSTTSIQYFCLFIDAF